MRKTNGGLSITFQNLFFCSIALPSSTSFTTTPSIYLSAPSSNTTKPKFLRQSTINPPSELVFPTKEKLHCHSLLLLRHTSPPRNRPTNFRHGRDPRTLTTTINSSVEISSPKQQLTTTTSCRRPSRILHQPFSLTFSIRIIPIPVCRAGTKKSFTFNRLLFSVEATANNPPSNPALFRQQPRQQQRRLLQAVSDRAYKLMDDLLLAV